MSALTPVAGYPAHAVMEYSRWRNQHGVPFTDWRGRCGAQGTSSGHGPFNKAGSARNRELCSKCFPGGLHNAVDDTPPNKVEGRFNYT